MQESRMPKVNIQEINQLIEYHLGVHDVQDNDRLLEDLGAESADLANIVASIEAKYSIMVTETEIANLYTPKDIFELIIKHLHES